MNDVTFMIVLLIIMFAVGSLFVINFQIKKPSNAQLCFLVTITGCIVIAYILCCRFHLIHIPSDGSHLINAAFKAGGCN